MRMMHQTDGSERRYRALYRYAKLSNVHREAKGDVKKSVEAEMQAYKKEPEQIPPEE